MFTNVIRDADAKYFDGMVYFQQCAHTVLRIQRARMAGPVSDATDRTAEVYDRDAVHIMEEAFAICDWVEGEFADLAEW